MPVLLDELSVSGTVFSYTEKFNWICRDAESYTLDSDGNLVFYFTLITDVQCVNIVCFLSNILLSITITAFHMLSGLITKTVSVHCNIFVFHTCILCYLMLYPVFSSFLLSFFKCRSFSVCCSLSFMLFA